VKVGFKKMIWLVVGALFGIAWFFASSRAYASHGKLPGIYIRAHTWYGEGYPIQELHARGEMLSLNWSDLEVGDTEAHRGYYFDNNRLRGWLEKEIAAGKAPALTLSVYNGRLAGGIAVPEYVSTSPTRWLPPPSTGIRGSCRNTGTMLSCRGTPGSSETWELT